MQKIRKLPWTVSEKKLRKRTNRWRYFIGPSPPLQVPLSVQSKCWKIPTRITPNTNTFHAALMGSNTKSKILMPMFPLYKSQDRLTFFFWYYYRRHFTKIRYLPLVNFTPQMSKMIKTQMKNITQTKQLIDHSVKQSKNHPNEDIPVNTFYNSSRSLQKCFKV